MNNVVGRLRRVWLFVKFGRWKLMDCRWVWVGDRGVLIKVGRCRKCVGLVWWSRLFEGRYLRFWSWSERLRVVVGWEGWVVWIFLRLIEIR